MRLQISKTKNAESFYVVRSVYEKGKRTNVIIEKLGTLPVVKEKAGGKDPYEWAKEYVEELNRKEKETVEPKVTVELSPNADLDTDSKIKYKAGHLFLQKLFYQLGWNQLSGKVKSGTDSEIPLNTILQMLLYTRILYPRSKKASWELYEDFLPAARAEKVQLHQVYKALDLIADKNDVIQEFVYKSTEKYCKRNTDVLYYDCTNFFFEIESEDDFRKYGHSKENRPNPIVQMGMFIDGDGIPLAVTIYPGNDSEQRSLKPLEEKILKDFELSRFIVCTDAGLASKPNRLFNSIDGRRYVVTQSLKNLPDPVREWALEPQGWRLEGDTRNKYYNINEIDENVHLNSVFYKEQIVPITNIDQRLVVTYSIKSRNYQRTIRQRQIDRAVKTVTQTPEKMEAKRQTDYKRLIQMSFFTEEGEVSTRKQLRLDTETISREEMYDGFYGICTNLMPVTEKNPGGTTVAEILRINHMRWQIEDCFRDMKTEFKSRPVYLSRENRIKAHFLLCCLSLILLKYLEKALRDAKYTDFTTEMLLNQLKEVSMVHLKGHGYVPAFNPSPLLSALQGVFQIPINKEIITEKSMKKITSVSSQG
jgi:transposase